jgi:hypothetical protein
MHGEASGLADEEGLTDPDSRLVRNSVDQKAMERAMTSSSAEFTARLYRLKVWPYTNAVLDNESLAVIRVATGIRCALKRVEGGTRRFRLVQRPQSRPHVASV